MNKVTAKKSREVSGERKLITISVPVYNEAENIDRLIEALEELANIEAAYDFEFLFTDNASTDNTFERLTEKSHTEKRIRILRFSRNFGFQKSILTNFLNARGDAAVQLDADLQDPPQLVSEFLRHWENGYKVVYGIRRHRQEGVTLNTGRRLFYWMISVLSDTQVPRDAGDFRLIDRTIINHLESISEQTPYLRGVIASLGYQQTGVPYDRDSRQAGRSKFGFMKLVDLAVDAVTAQSTKPLRMVTIFGICMTIVSAVMILFYGLLPFFSTGGMPSGFTTIVLLLLFLIGLNAVMLGLIGEYVGRIFNNTRSLPITIIEHRVESKD